MMAPQESQERGNDKKDWVMLISLAFAMQCTCACTALQAPFFPKEATSKGATSTEYGLIFGTYMFSIVIFSPVVAKMITYVSPKLVVDCGMVLFSVTTVLFGVLDYVTDTTIFVSMAFIIRAIEGIGGSAVRVSSFSIAGKVFKNRTSFAYAILTAFMSLGYTIGPTIGGLLYDVGGYGLPFYSMGVVVFLDAIVIFFTLPKVEEKKNKAGESHWKKIIFSARTIIFATSLFLSTMLTTYLHATLEPSLRMYEISSFHVGLLFALCSITSTVTSPICGWICDNKLDEKYVCIIGNVLTIVTILLLSPMPLLGLETSLTVITIGTALWGLSLSITIVSCFSEVQKGAILDGLPDELSTYGQVAAVLVQSRTLGSAIGPIVGGYCLDTIGFDNGLVILLVAHALVIIVEVVYILQLRIRSDKDAASSQIPVIALSIKTIHV